MVDNNLRKKVYLHYINNCSLISIKGNDALDLIDRLTTNDVSSLKPMEPVSYTHLRAHET